MNIEKKFYWIVETAWPGKSRFPILRQANNRDRSYTLFMVSGMDEPVLDSLLLANFAGHCAPRSLQAPLVVPIKFRQSCLKNSSILFGWKISLLQVLPHALHMQWPPVKERMADNSHDTNHMRYSKILNYVSGIHLYWTEFDLKLMPTPSESGDASCSAKQNFCALWTRRLGLISCSAAGLCCRFAYVVSTKMGRMKFGGANLCLLHAIQAQWYNQ